jgi:hypothetical protein
MRQGRWAARKVRTASERRERAGEMSLAETHRLRRRDSEQAPLAGHALELVSAPVFELEP